MQAEMYPDTYEGCLQFTLIALFYYTGIRRQELIHLTWWGRHGSGTWRFWENEIRSVLYLWIELKAYMKAYEVAKNTRDWKRQQPI